MKMNKTETVKALFKPLGYLFGGISLIIMTLFMLGYLMDELIQIFGIETMPFGVSLIPLGIMLTGVAWGGYFIWRGWPAFIIVYNLLCRLADVIILNRVSHKAKVLVGALLGFSGIIIVIIAIIQATIHLGFDGGVMGVVSPLGLIGWAALLFGLIVTHDIKKEQAQQSNEKV
jgi:hypothetical protein